jgi:signal transduction histidine kinase
MAEVVRRLEITRPENLDHGRSVMVDHHSLLNLFNVLEKELESVNQLLLNRELQHYSEFCIDVLMDLSGPVSAEQWEAIEDRFSELGELVRTLIASCPEQRPALQGILEILEIASARLGEFRRDRFEWKPIPCSDFLDQLTQFLTATARVSRGRFHFVFSPKPPAVNSYCIDFKTNASGDALCSPPILQDTIRDLVGNSRKYSPPGTTIRIRLCEERPAGLRLTVSDEGIGIPADELEKVVLYGYRASNALDRKTMGGGFGLTKACQLAHKFDGQFFIESQLGKGTTIEMTLFPPA